MPYHLGIDLGTTYTAAAIERDGLVEAATLGNRTASVPSVVFLRDDGEILVGEAATRRAVNEPGRVGREFKRRVGDPTPIILGGTPYAAEMLMARLLRWSLDRVHEQQGTRPRGIALTHPANWGPYKLDLLKQAVRQVDVDVDMTLPEPVAAATFYASQRRLQTDAVVAVYDLGGGTFDAAMVRRTAHGFEIIGSPEGIERLGGIDFDEAVYAHVRAAIGESLDEMDPEEPTSVAAMARLRQECIDAKEALSSDTDVSIPVLLPNLQTEVRLTRSEFEAMIRPAIGETIVALRRSIRSANVDDGQISAVLLVGGSSRIPLVAQMVGAELGRPIAIDAHPKDAISFGGAIAVAQRKGQATPESVTTLLPRDQRPPPPTMSPGTHRPPPPLPAPPVSRPAPPAAATTAASARPAPPAADPRPAPPTSTPAGTGTPAAARPPTRPGTPGTSPTPTPSPYGAGVGNQAASPPSGAYGAGQAAPGSPVAGNRAYHAPSPVAGVRPPGARPVPPGASPVGGMPAVGGPGHQPSAHTAAGYTSGQNVPGGMASGGYGTARRSDDRTLLLIAIGVAALLLLVIIGVLLSRGGGDESGYSDTVRDNFVENCAAEVPRTSCECAIDTIADTVPFDEFDAWDQDVATAVDAGESVADVETPEDIQAALDDCGVTSAGA